ncbi:hypothetical protein [Paracoccus yeei]|uniref:hypothetical protein n=1 Tax=Paracoccus yeei TaxID=147645 RepID=UPI00117F2505|nr:hypothetical protein [Paracoccus yeei]
MTRAIAKLLGRAEAALVAARRRVRPDPLAGLSPVARRMVQAWYAARSPEQQYAAWLDESHILSGSDVDIYEIPENLSSRQLAELYEKVKDND